MSMTRRQQEILAFVKDFLSQNGYSPTLDEIAHHFGINSLNGVYKHLKALEQRGLIHRLSNQARSIQVIEKTNPATTLPLLGRVAAGRPLEAVNTPEEICVPASFLTGKSNYVLRVNGDSMIDEQIRDGDYVVMEQRQYANNGEIVIALVDGESATLKKYYREGSQIRLQPANEALDPILLDENRVQVQGVVVGLMRKY
ncbi:MAG: transcriptional repressor LexA [Acidobacteria bacterium]|nr:MAG: transcriptional repressor LexA [Acidobacteriota bacterium]